MNCPQYVGRRQPFVAVLLVGVSVLLSTGCRTTSEDVQRWGNTVQGPRKLVSVLTHDKYPISLRVEAALTLISMKPRAGRRVGIGQLVEALNQLPLLERTKIVGDVVPRLAAEIRKPPKGTKEAREDTSVAYKDAAYALLTNETGSLVSDPPLVETLRKALTHWALTDFSNRMDDSSQTYGMEQILRYLKAPGVRGLPALVQPDTPKLDRICDLIAELGDLPTKLDASKRLVLVAREINSDHWKKALEPRLDAANKASKLSPKAEQFQKQLDQYQEEELLRVFGSMKKIGQGPIVSYLLELAADKSQSEKRRATALAALENNIDKDDPKAVERIIALAGADDTPDTVRDVALRRVGEMPRKLVVDRLYALFESKNWKVRWVAAELILKMSDVTHVDEFMSHLRDVKHMSLTEPLRYGSLIGEMKKGKLDPLELVTKYTASSYRSAVRLSALGYYYDKGTQADVSLIEGFSKDTDEVPECLKDAPECEWKCNVTEDGKPIEKAVKTVGDFVSYCLLPAMKSRAAVKAAPAKTL